jgi:hypothetical protein
MHQAVNRKAASRKTGTADVSGQQAAQDKEGLFCRGQNTQALTPTRSSATEGALRGVLQVPL